MKLAHIVLKLDKIGSGVPKRYVTPAEVAFLVADHHERAGDDAITRLTELEDDAEDSSIKKTRIEVERLQEEMDALDKLDITDEIREKRTSAMQRRIQIKEDVLKQLEYIVKLRKQDNGQEKRRLCGIYGAKRVEKIFPGAFPALPETFQSAREAGVVTNSPSERFLVTVGDTGG